MNIKIKASGVYCLLGDDYGKVYTALKKQFGDGEEQLFTERTPGHDYLQWELPGEGWTSLSGSDPLMSQEVRKELQNRCQAISRKFGNNQATAQRILSVPDDSYIYYKADESGHLIIRLTAWGYRYPERVGGGDTSGAIARKEATEHTVIKLIYDGNPMPQKEFKLNGYKRNTDDSGILDVGDLPIGYQFDVEADGQKQHITIAEGQGELIIDLTKFTTIEVKVLLDGGAYDGAVAKIIYGDKNVELTCDAAGRAIAKMPISLNNGICTVSVGSEMQQKALSPTDINTFLFCLMFPKQEIVSPPEPPVNVDGGEANYDKPVETDEMKEPVQPDEIKDEQVEENNEEEKNDDNFGNIQDEEEKERQAPQTSDSLWIIVGEIGAALALATLTALTYSFCAGVLVG